MFHSKGVSRSVLSWYHQTAKTSSKWHGFILFSQKCFVVPSFTLNGRCTGTPSPPRRLNAGTSSQCLCRPAYCRHCVCLTVQLKTFFLKCWQPCFQRRPVFWECSYTSRLSTIGVVVRHSVLYWYFTAKHTWMFTSEAPVAPCHQLVLLLVYMI